MSKTGSSAECGCKVGRVAEEHAMGDVHETLRRRWEGDVEEEQSVRTLTDFFNKRILLARLQTADVEVLDGEVDNMYRLLTGDTSSGMETQVHRQLERRGISVETLLDDFVSHQTIYRHLTDCLDAERDTSLTEDERIDRERERLGRLQNKSEAVSNASLTRLARDEAIVLGSFDVIVSFRVACETCGTHHDVTDVLQRGGCDCQAD